MSVAQFSNLKTHPVAEYISCGANKFRIKEPIDISGTYTPLNQPGPIGFSPFHFYCVQWNPTCGSVINTFAKKRDIYRERERSGFPFDSYDWSTFEIKSGCLFEFWWCKSKNFGWEKKHKTDHLEYSCSAVTSSQKAIHVFT